MVDVPTDRGFWVDQNGQRMFAILIDQPKEKPVDINKGQQLQVESATFRDPAYLNQIAGAPLTQSTKSIADKQPIYLVVDESNITVTNRPS